MVVSSQLFFRMIPKTYFAANQEFLFTLVIHLMSVHILVALVDLVNFMHLFVHFPSAFIFW